MKPEQNNMKPEQNNMNTPTPRTDAEVNNRPRTIQQFMGDSLRDALVPSNFARTLERELTTVTQQLTKAYETIGTMIDQIGMLQLKDKAITDQWDRLTKAIEPLKYWRDISECDCSNPLPQGGCLRCDLDKILNLNQPNHERHTDTED